MEAAVLLIFCAMMLASIIADIPILIALVIGLGLFSGYAFYKRYSVKEVLTMIRDGARNGYTMAVLLILVGSLAASWRASGTIAVIISYASGLIRPDIFLLMCFLLNCMVSFLLGTAYGTAATMGIICMTMSNAMGLSPALTGGAILSGIYFGDRISPVSGSAILVSELTKTDLFANIKLMFRSCAVPFAAACAAYLGLGFTQKAEGAAMDIGAVFSREFTLHWIAIIPAAIILILALFKVKARTSMLISTVCAVLIALLLQKQPVLDMLRFLVTGYTAKDPEAAVMLDGGGIFSNARVVCIVLISSAFSGIFKKTGLLDGLKHFMFRLSGKITRIGAMIVSSLLTVTVSCNQVMSTILTHQLCEDFEPDRQTEAVDLEDTVIVIAPLLPWCVAGAVPMAMLGAPQASFALACYLWFLPIARLVTGRRIPPGKLEK